MVRQGSAKPLFPGSNPGAASNVSSLGKESSAAGLRPFSPGRPKGLPFLLLFALALSSALAPAGSSMDLQERADRTRRDIWSEGWVSDIPTVDLTGTWLFDDAASDPMIEAWRDREVRYQISQQPDHIDFEFMVEGGYSTVQSYRWDGTVTRFNRTGSEVEEIARWTDAGRVFEVRGHWWPEDTPDEITVYELRYALRIFRFTFTQTNDSGSTVWTFVKERR